MQHAGGQDWQAACLHRHLDRTHSQLFLGAEATSFGSLAASRALQGFCMAPMEALVPASIADIWFVHERGFRTAIFNLGVLGGINLASPIGKHQG